MFSGKSVVVVGVVVVVAVVGVVVVEVVVCVVVVVESGADVSDSTTLDTAEFVDAVVSKVSGLLGFSSTF